MRRVDLGLVLVMCAIWAGNYFVMKAAFAFVDPVTFAFLRAFLPGVLLLAFGGFTLRGVTRSDIAWLGFIGIFNVTFFLVFLTVGLVTVNPGVASTLIYTQPVFVVIFSPLVGEKLTLRKVAGIAAAFAGIGMIFFSSLHGFVLSMGDVYELLASLSWTIAILLFKVRRSLMNSRLVTGIQSIIGGALIVPVIATQRTFLVPATPFWFYLAYNVVLVGCLGYVIFWKVLSDVPASEFTSYLFLVPVFATVMGSLLSLSIPPWNEVAGTALVAVGIVTVNRWDAKDLKSRG